MRQALLTTIPLFWSCAGGVAADPSPSGRVHPKDGDDIVFHTFPPARATHTSDQHQDHALQREMEDAGWRGAAHKTALSRQAARAAQAGSGSRRRRLAEVGSDGSVGEHTGEQASDDNDNPETEDHTAANDPAVDRRRILHSAFEHSSRRGFVADPKPKTAAGIAGLFNLGASGSAGAVPVWVGDDRSDEPNPDAIGKEPDRHPLIDLPYGGSADVKL